MAIYSYFASDSFDIGIFWTYGCDPFASPRFLNTPKNASGLFEIVIFVHLIGVSSDVDQGILVIDVGMFGFYMKGKDALMVGFPAGNARVLR